MLPRENPKYDKLFKVRFVIDSVLANCKKIPQEEKHSIDEQIIPTKCRSGAGCIKKWLKLTIVSGNVIPIRSAYLRVNHYLTTK
jgi:hypothetical protein